MKPKKFIKSFGPKLRLRVIGSTCYDAEAYMIDKDGKKWHVSIKALPQHVDVGIPEDPGRTIWRP